MGFIVLRHGQNGDQGDGALLSQLPAGTLIDRGQIGIEVAWEAAASRNLLLGGRNLPQGLSVVGDIRHDDQDMHILLKRQILCGGQGHAGRGNPLHSGVVGQVGEHHRPVDGSGALELADKKLRLLKGNADGGEHHGEIGSIVPDYPRLAGNLSRQVCMGQAGAGEDRQLLSAHQGVQSVNGADASLDELVGIVPGRRVHRQSVDVPVLLRQDVGAAVNGPTHAVEYPPQHVGGHTQLQGVSQEADLGIRQVDAGCGFKELDHSGISVDLQHLAAADGAVLQLHLYQLVIGDVLHHADHHQRADNLLHGSVFSDHTCSPPWAVTVSISWAISASIRAYSWG